jgi:DNA-directed RNA polymerase specialized sigma24 family protein
VVDAEEFVAVFLATYANAVRAAEAIVGVAEGEDAAMDAALYLWRRRDTLEAIRPRLFLIAARQRAHHHRLSAWRRHVVPVEDLVDVEAMTAAFAVGGPRPAPVRLPEPVA